MKMEYCDPEGDANVCNIFFNERFHNKRSVGQISESAQLFKTPFFIITRV